MIPDPDPIIQGIVRKAPPAENNPDFYQEDVARYAQQDRIKTMALDGIRPELR